MNYLKIAAAVFLGHWALNFMGAFVQSFQRSRRWQAFFEFGSAFVAFLICVM
jgi:hypothetical protein